MKFKCLSIAGFDGSGGAGLQADIKTFSALGCYGMSVLTALPIQNTLGVKSTYDIPSKSIEEQLEIIFYDIVPDSIKVGMLFTKKIIELVSRFLRTHALNIPIVLDPVMVAKSGDSLLKSDAIKVLKSELIPLASILTPNLPEAYKLVGNIENRELLADRLLALGPKALLLKGGHSKSQSSDDLFVDQSGKIKWLKTKRIQTKNTHGSGCTLSAAICAFLAQNMSPFDSCKLAKNYLRDAIYAAKDKSVGKGFGPVHHFYHVWERINKAIWE